MAAYSQLAFFPLDEASSGTSPTQVTDSENALTVPITYNSNANWTSVAAGNGVQFTAVAGSATGALISRLDFTGTALASGISGATEMSAYGVFSATDVDDGCVIFIIGRDDGLGGLFSLRWTGDAGTGFNGRWNNDDAAGAVYYDMPGAENVADGDLHTFVLVFDPASTDDLNLWIDGNSIPVGFSEDPAGALPTITADHFIAIGNHLNNSAGFTGRIMALGIGTGVLTSGQISDIHTALLSNNDVDPLAAPAAPTLTAGPTITDIVAGGFTVNGTADQNCTVSVVVVDYGDPAPSSGDYDASAFTESATADTPFAVEVTL